MPGNAIRKGIFVLAAVGVIGGLVAAHFYGRQKPPDPPVFNPAPDPYARGIYANGIIESFQTNGENINIFPEVSGSVTQVLVSEGQIVKMGSPLVQLDDSVQRAVAEQYLAQSQAALAHLQELKAEPRKETLDVSIAQVQAAQASLKNVRDQLRKIRFSYRINPQSVSKNDFDNAVNAVRVAERNLEVSKRQYDLTKAGAWIYDIQDQEKQYASLTQQYESAKALLDKYVLKAPMDGVVLAISTAVGSYVSPQGIYGTYTQGQKPVIVMGGSERYLQVRTYVDEILVHRLPPPDRLGGRMFIRGTNVNVPLEYVRIEPYVTPKIQLSDQRQERVDVRVLPIIFKFENPGNVNLYPGQLVDVYLGENEVAQLPGKIPQNTKGAGTR